MVCRKPEPNLAQLQINRSRQTLPRESFEREVAIHGATAGATDSLGPSLPPEFGSARFRTDILRPGMVIAEIESRDALADLDYRFELAEPMHDITVHLGERPQSAGLEGLEQPVTLCFGDSHLLSAQTVGTMYIKRGEGCHEFNLFLRPENVGYLLESEGLPGWEEALRLLEEGQRRPIIHTILWTPAIRVAVEQIRSCPYCGILREIYLEAKALELIALRLEQALRWDSVGEREIILNARDRRILHEAREILESSMKDPPSIGELARMAGTNRTKLKTGFRQLFGVCVFEHLRHYRMQQALLLLRDFGMTVTEVAAAVGYSSVSAFSAAFHRAFGFPPREARALSDAELERRE